MISLPIGVVLLTTVLFYALSGMSLGVLLNPHALILVVVGTVGVLAVSTPSAGLRSLWTCLMALRRNENSTPRLHAALLALSRNKLASVDVSHPLVDYASELWEQGVDRDTFATLMAQRLDDLNHSTEQAVAAMRNLSKYPPALGMMGTVIGIVALFSGLTIEGKSNIGPALALAMTATLYGLVLANMLLMPLADRLHVLHLRKSEVNAQIFQAISLINDGEPTAIVKEGLGAAAAS
jgi:chemotaxis protein MotA